MICTYNANVAEIVGTDAATIFEYIMYFVFQSKCQKENYVSGKYWTYETRTALAKHFFFMSDKEINIALATLLQENFIETMNDNSSKPNWFTVGKRGESFFLRAYA